MNVFRLWASNGVTVWWLQEQNNFSRWWAFGHYLLRTYIHTHLVQKLHHHDFWIFRKTAFWCHGAHPSQWESVSHCCHLVFSPKKQHFEFWFLMKGGVTDTTEHISNYNDRQAFVYYTHAVLKRWLLKCDEIQHLDGGSEVPSRDRECFLHLRWNISSVSSFYLILTGIPS